MINSGVRRAVKCIFYRPDSGFSGSGEIVRIYRNQSAQQWIKDSSSMRLGSSHRDTVKQDVLRNTVEEINDTASETVTITLAGDRSGSNRILIHSSSGVSKKIRPSTA